MLIKLSKVKALAKTDQDKKRTISLSIELDDWSPIYETFNDKKYREKIALNAFDEEQPLQEQKINSYLDHKMSIEYLLASTKNKTMNVSKNGKTITAQIAVNEQDPLLKKTADLIEQGVLESNSFIFTAQDIERKYYDEPNAAGVDIEVIYKKGKLLSIDPVYEGFFPQNKTYVFNKDSNHLDEFFKLEDVNENEERQGQIEPKEVSEPPSEKENNISTTQQENEKQEQKEQEKQITQPQPEQIEKQSTTIKENTMIKDQEQQPQEIKKNALTPEQVELLRKNLTPQFNAKPVTFQQARAKFYRKEELTQAEKETLLSVMRKNLKDSYVYALKGGQAETLQRALDGVSDLKGLALVENILHSDILNEWRREIPELTEHATRVPLIGLNRQEYPIYIPDKTPAPKLAEAADSTPLNGQTFKVSVLPSRYSIKVSQNKQLSNFGNAFQAQTSNAINMILAALRKDFYANVFYHLDVTTSPLSGKKTITSLVTSTANLYEGGVTEEAKVETETAGKVTVFDLQRMVQSVKGLYGKEVLKDFRIAMHPDTFLHLAKQADSTRPNITGDLFNFTEETFAGIPIITAGEYVDKTIATNKKVALLFNVKSVMAYGLDIAIVEDPYVDVSKGLINRFVGTYGDIRLVDPYIASRYLQIK